MGETTNYDVVALGELLIDFTDSGLSNQGNGLFEANPGGAPCNLLAMLKKFGHEVAFIGKVGDDIFGRKLKSILEELDIGTKGLCMDENIRTTLAFVENDATGDRSFSFYRNPGADMMLKEDEVDLELIDNAKLFHFGTLSMTHENCRIATKKAVEYAKDKGKIISFDPNLRMMLWDDFEEMRKQMEYGLSKCDVLKISDNEIQWFTGCGDFDEGIKILKDKYDIKLILLSMGKDGSRAYYKGSDGKDICIEEAAVLTKNTIDTTGAGDTFGGCCLHFVIENGLDNFDEEKLSTMLKTANAAASIVTTRKGALKVMPAVEEILK